MQKQNDSVTYADLRNFIRHFSDKEICKSDEEISNADAQYLGALGYMLQQWSEGELGNEGMYPAYYISEELERYC